MPDTLTPEELAALAAYRGPVTVVPVGVGGEVVEHDYKQRIWAEARAKAYRQKIDAREAAFILASRAKSESGWRPENSRHMLEARGRLPVDLAIKLGVPA